MNDATKIREGFTLRRWFYAGRRLDAKNGLFYAWHDHEGELRYYSKIKGFAIGGAYDIAVKDDDPGSAVPDPHWVHDATPHKESGTWRALDSAAYTTHTMLQREAKAKREGADISDLTLAQVNETYRRLVGTQRTAFLAQVIARITK